eukprot:scaffold13357_cov194-Alexandrium_tamarense.AAC.7
MIPSSSLVYFISSLQSACPLPVFKSLYIVLSIVVHPSSGSFVSSASSQRFGITACNVCLSSIHVDLPYCCHSRSIDNCFYSSVRVSSAHSTDIKLSLPQMGLLFCIKRVFSAKCIIG